MKCDPLRVNVEVMSPNEVRILCGENEWRTIKRFDKGFDKIHRLAYAAKAAYFEACGCIESGSSD